MSANAVMAAWPLGGERLGHPMSRRAIVARNRARQDRSVFDERCYDSSIPRHGDAIVSAGVDRAAPLDADTGTDDTVAGAPSPRASASS